MKKLKNRTARILLATSAVVIAYSIHFFGDFRSVEQKLEDSVVHLNKSILWTNPLTGVAAVKKVVSATGYFIKHNRSVYVITNAHVCMSFSHLHASNRVELLGVVEIIITDTEDDLCIGKLTKKIKKGWSPTPLKLADSEPDYGDEAYTYGYPLMFGGVHRKGRVLNTIKNVGGSSALGLKMFVTWGQSGSPVVDKNGKVVCTIFARSGPSDSFGYCKQLYKLKKLLGIL